MIRRAASLAWRALVRFVDHSGPDRAAAVAFYTLLSLLPLLIFLISVGVALGGSVDEAYRGTLILFKGVVVHLDAPSLESLRDFVERATRFQWPGILLLAWTSRRIFAALFSALEAVFEVPGRSFVHGNLVAIAMVMVTGTALLATLALTMVSAGLEGLVLRFSIPVPGAGSLFHDLAGFVLEHVVPVAVTATFFFVLYRVAPRPVASVRHAAAGAVIATVLWEAAKAGFAYYVRDLAHYAGLYGALEAVIVLALWLELSVSVVLYGGEIVALLPERSAT